MPRARSQNNASADAEDGNSASKKGQKHDSWKAAEVAVLIHVLSEEKKLGRQAESGWAAESYIRVGVALKAQLAVTRTNDQIKSCWTWIKGQYKILKEIHDLSGFRYPKHRPFQNQPFVHYDSMAILCDDVMATGEDTFFNGATGGNQTINLLSSDDLNDNMRSVGGDEDDEDKDDDEGTHQALGDVSNAVVLSTPRSKPLSSVPSSSTISSKKLGHKCSCNNHVSSANILAGLAASVKSLAASFQDNSQSQSLSDSPARRDKAWNKMMEEEGADLSYNKLATTVEVFSNSKLADQYLKFPEARKSARHIWLNTAIGRVMGI
ncbi:hypothetical protein DFH09DRAFT_1324537 [Mycena vulgaris]|nr:hypothetical protein DFH09DRAFT_1324537 [Mycena vulgaris]